VLDVAAVAAVMSRTRLRPGAGAWRVGLVDPHDPLTADGPIYASSMVILDSARRKAPVSSLAR
jgi:hypothetical protein